MILWGATVVDDDETTLSWFASGEPGIREGSPEMVAAMMRDLGYQVSAVASYGVRHLRTNYLDGERWTDAWEITATLPTRVAELPLQGRSVESSASDPTWTGAPPSGAAEHVLFVDFADADVAERAERILGVVAREIDVTLSHRGNETAQLLASFGVGEEPAAERAEKAKAVFAQLGAKTSRA